MKNNFSKEDRSGLYFTALLMLCLLGLKWIDNQSFYRYTKKDFVSDSSIGLQTNLEDAATDLPLASEKKSNFVSIKKNFFRFDPNHITKDSLSMLPIDKRTLGNLIKYRDKGGKFGSVSDVMKIYGMEKYANTIAPYLSFESNEHNKSTSVKQENQVDKEILPDNIPSQVGSFQINPKMNVSSTFSKTSISGSTNEGITSTFEKEESMEKSKTKIELNGADQYELMMVNGIGAFYSKMIIDYRDKIGGFYDKKQILDIKGIQMERAQKWLDQLDINMDLVRKLNINAASFKQLSAFPTVGYKKAEIIKLYQKNNGDFKKIEDLLQVGVLNNEDLAVLKHYLVFN